jgi:hypothetical protein
MNKIGNLKCAECGAQFQADVSISCREDDGVLFVHYDPAHIRKVVVVNAGSGTESAVDLLKPASRQIAGIIGPY